MITNRGESVLSGERLVINDIRGGKRPPLCMVAESFLEGDVLTRRTWRSKQEDEFAAHCGIETSELRRLIRENGRQKLRQEVYRGALEKWGMEAQAFMAVEEMAELTKELCKVRRGKEDKAGLIDEIADVTIMLEQLQFLFGIGKQDIEKQIAAKIARLQMMIEE